MVAMALGYGSKNADNAAKGAKHADDAADAAVPSGMGGGGTPPSKGGGGDDPVKKSQDAQQRAAKKVKEVNTKRHTRARPSRLTTSKASVGGVLGNLKASKTLT